jgi:hypothetical protein
MCYVSGFPDWKSTLQFEWRWKQLTRTLPKDEPILRRMKALKILLSLEQSTIKAVPYSEWPAPPEIQFENDVCKQKYDL